MAQPRFQLKTDRNFIINVLLSMVTFGIYPLFFYNEITESINIIASPYDGKKTTNYILLMLVLAPITCGIWAIVWNHQISSRIGDELKRRGIGYNFSSSTFWLWSVLGSLIFVGPFIYSYKMVEAMNLLSADYNAKG